MSSDTFPLETPGRPLTEYEFFLHGKLKRSIAHGFYNGNQEYEDGNEMMQLAFDMAAYAAMDTIRDLERTNLNPLRHALGQTISGLGPIVSRNDDYTEDTKSPTSTEHLEWMLDRCWAEVNDWPVDKISRWIGYIQGVLTAKGQLNVDEERHRTRPIFHHAYTEMGLIPPETTDR